MTVWNAQSLNARKAGIEARFASRIARSAAKMTGMAFSASRVRGVETVWTTDPESRRREYGDGVDKPHPWANQAIREGVGRGRNQ